MRHFHVRFGIIVHLFAAHLEDVFGLPLSICLRSIHHCPDGTIPGVGGDIAGKTSAAGRKRARW